MSMTQEDIQRIASLAKLAPNAEKLAHYTQQCNDILTLIAQLQAVPTHDVKPLSHPLETLLPLTEDSPEPVTNTATLQKLTPHIEGGLYTVPAVLEGEA